MATGGRGGDGERGADVSGAGILARKLSAPLAEVKSCGDETGHARVEGTHSCRCGHRWFKYATAEEQRAGQERDAEELYAEMNRLGLIKPESNL